jgi:ankyrin repeat protein
MITSKTRILSCILGIILTSGVCEAVQHSDMEVQVDKGDFATFAYKKEWFKLVKGFQDSDFKAIGKISHFIEEGIDVNITDENGNSALYYAIDKNQLNLLSILLKCEKLKINLPLDINGYTALHLAAKQKNRLEVFKCLLQCKDVDINVFRINMPGAPKESVLSLAIKNGNIEAVKLLVAKERDIVNRAISDDGGTALREALSDSVGEDLFKVLIDAGADADIDIINPYNKEKKTIMEIAKGYLGGYHRNNALLQKKITLLSKSSKKATQPHSIQKKWFKAIEDNNISEVRQMIASQIDINTTDNSSLRMTALHIAARDSKKAEIAKLLIQNPLTDVNASDALGATPLFEAIKSENKEIVEYLLKHNKINLEVRDRSYMTLFYTAVSIGNLPIVELLSKDKRIKIDSIDERLFNMTSLHIAIDKKRANVVDFLLKNSLTDADAQNFKGEIPLYFAARASSADVVKAILFHLKNKKIKLSNQNYKDLILIINKERYSAEFLPFFKEWNKIIIEHILAERAAPCSNEDRSAWMGAERTNNLEKMGQMIKNGFDINVICASGGTALYNAVSDRNIEKINFLLKNGADVNVCGPWGYTPLWVAAILRKDKEILEILLKHPEADVNDPQDALLYSAVMKGSEDIAELLLSQKGIDVNFTASSGWTPLHTAACQNNRGITELLLRQNGINVNALDNKKKTPLHIAVEYETKEAVESLLEKKEIDIASLDIEQMTPLDIAIQQSNAEISLLLLKKTKEKGLKISDITYGRIKDNQNFYDNGEIHDLANKLKQNAVAAD